MAQEAIGSTPIRTTTEEVREPTGLNDLNENWILPILDQVMENAST